MCEGQSWTGKPATYPQAYPHLYTLEKAASLTLIGVTKSGLAPPKAPLKLWLKQVKTVRVGDPVIPSGPTIILQCIFKSWKLTSASERLGKGTGTGGNVCQVQPRWKMIEKCSYYNYRLKVHLSVSMYFPFLRGLGGGRAQQHHLPRSYLFWK